MMLRGLGVAGLLIFCASCGGQVVSSDATSPSTPASSATPANSSGSTNPPSAPAPAIDATSSQGIYASIAVWGGEVGTVYAASVVIDASGNVQPGGAITRIDTAKAQVFTDAKEIGLGQSLAVAGLVTTEPTYSWNDGSLINAKLPKTSGVQSYPGTAVPNTMILVDYTEMQVYCVVRNADSQVALVDFALTPSPGYSSSRTIFSMFTPSGFRIGNGTLYGIQNGVETEVDLANNGSTMKQTPIPGDDLPVFTDLTARTADGSVFLASNEGVWLEKNGAYSSFLKTTYGAVTQVEVSGKNIIALEVDSATNVATLVETATASASGETVLATDVTANARFAFDSVNVYFISADQTRAQHVAM